MGGYRFWAMLALLVAFGGQAEAQQRSETRIGALFLSHDPGKWRIEGFGDRFMFTCRVDACEHAVFAVEIESRPGGYCDKEEARRGAEARFAFADRHPVNTIGRDKFALVLAESRRGPDLFVEEAVFACLTRDDLIYKFISVAQDGKYPGYTGGILLHLLHYGLRMPEPTLHRLEVGDLVFTYPGDRFLPFVPPTAEGASLTCLPPTCREPEPIVGISLLPEDEPCPKEYESFAEQYRQDDEPDVIVADSGTAAIRFRLHEYWTGCRNWTPPIYVGCAVHDGKAYRISTPGEIGCRSGFDIPEDALVDLMQSAQPK